jgi:hypothetical protein
MFTKFEYFCAICGGYLKEEDVEERWHLQTKEYEAQKTQEVTVEALVNLCYKMRNGLFSRFNCMTHLDLNNLK